MTVTAIASNTGLAVLPDIGTLFYNGITWSCLYKSRISGKPILDNAGRTVKYVEYTLVVDGIVTLPDTGANSTIDQEWMALREQLTKQAGVLRYVNKGFGTDVTVNLPGGTVNDVAWGPIPTELGFTPLGANRSAQMTWQVKFHLTEMSKGALLNGKVLQFNDETTLSFDDDGYSRFTIKGTLEVPLTRTAAQPRGTILTSTVDDLRVQFMNRFVRNFNFEGFKVVRRNFNVSRDKRTLEWDYEVEELPPHNPPAFMQTARGSYSVKQEKSGPLAGSVKWICTLRATYVVPKGLPRNIAFRAFAALWAFRMAQSARGNVNPAPNIINPGANQAPAGAPPTALPAVTIVAVPNSINLFYNDVSRQINNILGPALNNNAKAFPIHFSMDEGVYLDSRTVTFQAGWRILTSTRALLAASGLWVRSSAESRNAWATSIRPISGGKSWIENRLNPADALIVDFGN